MMVRQMTIFENSEMTTAVVVKYMSPESTRVYRMLTISTAFWKVRITRLTYFMVALDSG